VLDSPFIGRIVVLVAPIIASISVIIANWVQDLIGADLDETQLTVFLTGVFVAICGVIYRWLANRGLWEVTQAKDVDVAAAMVEEKLAAKEPTARRGGGPVPPG
jgi:ABC-type enterochelin transport system permease subunit